MLHDTILIAGPTASGKSALALDLARTIGAIIVNADALQVYDCWRVLSARPSTADCGLVPHVLYGHVPYHQSYSVGAWLRDVARLPEGPKVIVGGTGLYLSALTEGLAEIPPVPESVRAAGDALRRDGGPAAFRDYLAVQDPDLMARVDRNNVARLQRAWEVHQATGRPLSAWQSETAPPLVPQETATRIVCVSEPDWLRNRISRRFDAMMTEGALDEVRAMAEDWDPARPSSRALGAAELMAAMRGEMEMREAIDRAKIATAQFAKRQRTWFRSRMSDWTQLHSEDLADPQRRLAVLSAL